MRIKATAICATLSFLSSAASAKDFFDHRPNDSLRRVREAVEILREVAPIPSLSCKPTPNLIRYCSTVISDGLTLSVDSVVAAEADTPEWRAAYDEFKNDVNGGKTYEISLNLKDRRSEQAPSMFVTLCAAAWMSVSPKLKASVALERIATTLRKSKNKAAMNDGEIEIVGDPATLIVDTWPSGMASCRVSAEDDYRLPKR